MWVKSAGWAGAPCIAMAWRSAAHAASALASADNTNARIARINARKLMRRKTDIWTRRFDSERLTVSILTQARSSGGLASLKLRTGIDLSVRHGMKAGNWGGRRDLSRIRLNCQGDSRAQRQGVVRPELFGTLQKGFSAMNFRILATAVGPRGRLLALLAATALAVPFVLDAQAQTPAPAPAAPKAAPKAPPAAPKAAPKAPGGPTAQAPG